MCQSFALWDRWPLSFFNFNFFVRHCSAISYIHFILIHIFTRNKGQRIVTHPNCSLFCLQTFQKLNDSVSWGSTKVVFWRFKLLTTSNMKMMLPSLEVLGKILFHVHSTPILPTDLILQQSFWPDEVSTMQGSSPFRS